MTKEIKYHRYTIRYKQSRDIWQARAFRDLTHGPIYSGTTEEEVILAVKTALDKNRLEQRELRSPIGVPTAVEYREALDFVKMTDEQRAMLNAHFEAPNHILTATELANAGGYPSYSSANSQYGKLARNIAEELEWKPPMENGMQTWTLALATGADDSVLADTGEWRWRLRDEVVQAMRICST